MNEYIQAFINGMNYVPYNCNLTGLYGRITRGINEDDFSRLSPDPNKRLSWVFDHETLCNLLGMSHLDMLTNLGHTVEWIRYQLNANKKFKLIIFSASSDEVKLATWDNIFELLIKSYPEIDSNMWFRYSKQLKEMTFQEIDPEGIIIKNYYLGPDSDEYMHINRFLSLKNHPTLLQVRAFLHNQIGLNELFGGNGRTITHEGVLLDKEYLTNNRFINEFNQYAILDLNPILP
ncbi:unnamed protein product [Rotaria sordida]|uniref:Uncharacterized protein n=1 Tax=Rotaria sordida TaxID=392033 RepID=A0A815HV01_9BILA|nr:unnamed protein product [Rotaria sordida]CAF3867277.1 unnamed protein product [Rotaria sordida]